MAAPEGPVGHRVGSAVYIILLVCLGQGCARSTLAPGRFVFRVQAMQVLVVQVKNPRKMKDRGECTPAIYGGPEVKKEFN